jgi:putative ABC transport system permease protein
LAEVGILAGISTLIAAGAVLAFGEILIGGLAGEAPVLMAVFRIRTAFIAASAGLAGLLVCGLVALAGVLLFPAALGSRERLGGARARGQVWLNVITAGQASATAALVAGAMLLAVNLVGLKRMEMGVDIADVTLVSVGRGYAHERPAKTEAFLQRLAARLAEEPTIESVSLAISAPFLSSVGVAVNAPDHPGVWQTKGGVPYLNAVSSNYFRGVGMRFLRGRPFTTADSLSLRKVAINETFARTMGSDREPIGRCIILGADSRNPCYEVIGVVADARRFTIVPEEPSMQVYVPIAQNIFRSSYPTSVVLVKAAGTNAEAMPAITRMVREDVPREADVSVTSLEELVDPQIRPWRASGAIWGLFGVVAMMLTCVGVYGALAYAVEQRHQEIAIRQALGAGTARVFMQMGLQNAVGCFVGIAIGCGIALWTKDRGLIPLESTAAVTTVVVLTSGTLVAAAVVVAIIVPLARVARRPIARSLQG